MPKVRIKLKINDFLLEKDGIFEDNNLYFEDDNVKYEFNFTDIILKRESPEFLSIIKFGKVDGNNYYKLKELNKEINNKLVIKELQVLKNIVIIRYEIVGDNFNFVLSYEEE